jgi:hypothetical protein
MRKFRQMFREHQMKLWKNDEHFVYHTSLLTTLA